MLGYCKPDKQELKVKDVKRYSSFYCALCIEIRRTYGFFYSLSLSNDATFLLICLDALSDHNCDFKGRCHINPLHRINLMISKESLSYAAFINYYLLLEKLRDASIDMSNALTKKFARMLYKIVRNNKLYKRELDKHQVLVNKLDREFDMLHNEERESSSFDDLTNSFGAIIQSIADGYQYYCYDEAKTDLGQIFFNMGKWLYLADALNDYNKDIKTSQFNLLQTIRIEGGNNSDQYIQKSIIILYLLQRKMINVFHTIRWQYSEEIIQNIITHGTTAILKKLTYGWMNKNAKLKRRS